MMIVFRHSLLVILLALCGLLAASAASLAAAGDGQADAVREVFRANEDIRVYCRSCKQVAFRAIGVESLEFDERKGALQYCVVNGEYVPPERIYVSRDGRWTNLVGLADLDMKDQPKFLDPRLLAWDDAQALEGYFVGSIGAHLTVQMLISFVYGTVEGEYFYEKVGTPLRIWAKTAELLSGEPRRYAVELVEEVEGRTTGFFFGVFDPSRESFGGIWAPREGYATRTFDLTRVATRSSLTGPGGSVTFIRFLEPSGHWQSLNDSLEKEALDHIADYSDVDAEGAPLYDSSLEQNIVYYGDRILCMLEEVFVYSGGARPNTGLYGSCFRRYTNTIVPLEKLESVLDLDDDKTAKLVGEYLRAELDGLIREEFREPFARHIPTFWLIPEGLVLCVAPGEVGCYGRGSRVIAIPHSWFRQHEIALKVVE